MKKLLLVIITAALLAGCTSSTNFGDCIGIADERDPGLVYKLSVWNAVLAVVFVEMIIPPVVVLANETYCPVGVKPQAQKL